MDARWPAVIAHRGASGYLPEHTRAAKVLAYGMGADFLEQDVIASRDGELFVLHDIYLDETTDVALRFPSRRRTDGRFYAIDFDAGELRSLRAGERRRSGHPLFPDRFRDRGHDFRVMTLDEELALVAELNRQTGRQVGVYPELKEPGWHRRYGIDLADRVLRCLAAHGYGSSEDRVFVQCFDHQELRRLRCELGTSLPLVQLLDDSRTHDELVASEEALTILAETADAIGPSLKRLWSVGAGDSGLAKRAQNHGLLVHPYTFTKETTGSSNLDKLLRVFMGEIGVDGVFCDFPDVAVRVRQKLFKET